MSFANIGKIENKGWELSITGNKFLKVKKFSLSASFNMAQNANELLEMNKDVLATYNTKFEDVYNKRGNGGRMNKVEVGAPLCSIYGYQSKGVFQYSYEYLQNYNTKMKQQNPNWTSTDYENQINQWLAEGKSFPVATDANGPVSYTHLTLPTICSV